jgi:dienelactone hydrolase
MKFKGLIVAIFLSALFASISLSIGNESNVQTNDNNSSKDINESRFYIDRSNFETHLIRHIPAPQEYKNELPPVGVTEIIYNSRNLTLKAWLSDNPQDGKKHPAIVYAHGGFSFGGSDWKNAQDFMNQGFVLMTPALRGENGNPGYFEFFYGEVNDLIAAGDYLANVSYVDKDRIFLCGHSSGGTLSMLASMMPSKYRAIASFGGSPDQEEFFNSGWWQIAPFDIRNIKEIELRSPIVYSDSIIKPLFIYVGDQDDYVGISRIFVDRAKENGRPCEINLVKGDHFSSVDESIKLSLAEFMKINDYVAVQLNQPSASTLVQEGLTLYSSRKYADSINRYNKAIEIDPNHADAWNDKGVSLKALGNNEEAIKCFDKALEIDPNHVEALTNKGAALGESGNFAESMHYLDKALKLDPLYAKAWLGKGLNLGSQGIYDEAIACFDEAIKLDSELSTAYWGKSVALTALHHTDEANEALSKAKELGWKD